MATVLEDNNKILEDTKLTIERYHEAVRDEIGLLNTKIVLSLFLSRDSSNFDEGMFIAFLNQSLKFLKFLEERLSITKSTELESVERLRSSIESIKLMDREKDEKYTKLVSDIDMLIDYVTPLAEKARDEYRRTFRRYRL